MRLSVRTPPVQAASAETRSGAKRSKSCVERGSPLSLRRTGVPPPIPCASPARPTWKESGGCALLRALLPLETLKKSEAAPPFALGSGESRLYTLPPRTGVRSSAQTPRPSPLGSGSARIRRPGELSSSPLPEQKRARFAPPVRRQVEIEHVMRRARGDPEPLRSVVAVVELLPCTLVTISSRSATRTPVGPWYCFSATVFSQRSRKISRTGRNG